MEMHGRLLFSILFVLITDINCANNEVPCIHAAMLRMQVAMMGNFYDSGLAKHMHFTLLSLNIYSHSA